MFYCFLEDETFYPKTNIDLGTTTPPEAGYLGSVEESYFYKLATIRDTRDIRLLFHNKEPKGLISLYFDQSKHTTDSLFNHITDDQLGSLFKLLERVYLSENESLSDIEADLITNIDYKNIYVPSSLTMSKETVGVTVNTNDGSFDTAVPLYFDITVDFVEHVKFRIYLSRKFFRADYPLSTIVQVVLPCDHTYIINPSKFNSPIDAIIKGSDFSFPSIDTDVQRADQSGLMVYKTKYNVSPSSIQLLPFGILYNGAQPSTMEIRKAIREKLLGYGTADEEIWKRLLPDLFVTGQFFIIPLWDNTTVRVDGNMYPSIVSVSKFTKIIPTVFPSMERQFIDKYQEILTVGQSEIFLTTIPDSLNENNTYSIYELHPTYQYHTSQDAAFAYMAETTREFNIKLNRCMAVLVGETTSADIVESTIDDKKFMSFVSTGIEYHVLTKDSFNTIF